MQNSIIMCNYSGRGTLLIIAAEYGVCQLQHKRRALLKVCSYVDFLKYLKACQKFIQLMLASLTRRKSADDCQDVPLLAKLLGCWTCTKLHSSFKGCSLSSVHSNSQCKVSSKLSQQVFAHLLAVGCLPGHGPAAEDPAWAPPLPEIGQPSTAPPMGRHAPAYRGRPHARRALSCGCWRRAKLCH